MLKNVSGQAIGAQIVSATDGSAFTGTVTVYVTGDAGTQAVGSVGAGACTNEGHGYYTYAPAQSETNFNLIAFTFIGTGAVPVTVQVNTEAQWAVAFAKALLALDLSSVSGEAARSMLNAMRFIRNKWTLTGAVLSVKKEDDTTEAWNGIVSTDSSAAPIVGSDPS